MNDSGPEGGSAGAHENAQHLGGEWRRSSYSMSNGQCVEVARLAGGDIGVRDSKAAQGHILRFAPRIWAGFLTNIRSS